MAVVMRQTVRVTLIATLTTIQSTMTKVLPVLYWHPKRQCWYSCSLEISFKIFHISKATLLPKTPSTDLRQQRKLGKRFYVLPLEHVPRGVKIGQGKMKFPCMTPRTILREGKKKLLNIFPPRQQMKDGGNGGPRPRLPQS